MSPSLQFTATSALLFVCMHLSVGAPLPADNPATKRTGTEALNSVLFPNRLFPDFDSKCASIAHLENVNLPRPLNVSGCNSTVSSISTKLNYLVYVLAMTIVKVTTNSHMIRV